MTFDLDLYIQGQQGSTLAQAMACCLMALKPLLKQILTLLNSISKAKNINLRAISQEIPKPLINELSLKIT